MKISLIFIAFTLIQICQVDCTLGVETKFFVTPEQFQCIKNGGYQFVMVRAYRSYGAVDPIAVQMLKSALNAGFKTLITMPLCRSKDAVGQVEDVIRAIPLNLYTTPYINIDINLSPGCDWVQFDYASNCQYVKDMIKTFQTYGKNPGIYGAPRLTWRSIFGTNYGCPELASQPLMYGNYDNNTSFDDYKQIGGWTKPNMKEFQGGVNFCGGLANLVYAYP